MKIGILTSGGDAPGMNACIRALVRCGVDKGDEIFGFYDGFRGLVENRFVKLSKNDVANIVEKGGTILGTSRLPEFKYEQVRKMSIKNIEKNELDVLIIVGGDGAYLGAEGLKDMGINVIAIPATIDNDIPSSDHSIGFSTALNTTCEVIDRLRNTSSSHQWCSIVEVTGDNCEDLALYAGLACGAEYVITSKTGLNKDELLKNLKQDRVNGKFHSIVVISEDLTDVVQLAKDIEKYSGYECRETVLGYATRGGSPTPEDRIRAARFGSYAIEVAHENKFGVGLGLVKNEMVTTPLEMALKVSRKPNDELNSLLQKIK